MAAVRTSVGSFGHVQAHAERCERLADGVDHDRVLVEVLRRIQQRGRAPDVLGQVGRCAARIRPAGWRRAVRRGGTTSSSGLAPTSVRPRTAGHGEGVAVRVAAGQPAQHGGQIEVTRRGQFQRAGEDHLVELTGPHPLHRGGDRRGVLLRGRNLPYLPAVALTGGGAVQCDERVLAQGGRPPDGLRDGERRGAVGRERYGAARRPGRRSPARRAASSVSRTRSGRGRGRAAPARWCRRRAGCAGVWRGSGRCRAGRPRAGPWPRRGSRVGEERRGRAEMQTWVVSRGEGSSAGRMTGRGGRFRPAGSHRRRRTGRAW